MCGRSVGPTPWVNTSSFQGTLIEHWDGSKWAVIPSPNAKGSSQNTLTGVAVINANDIWAVGYTLTSNNQPLTMHWNGSMWSIVPSPNGPYDNWLSGVAALATNNVWAVGATNNGGEYVGFALERFALGNGTESECGV